MKHSFTIYLLTFSILVNGQVKHSVNKAFPLPKVDKRVELLSLVFRIAGSPEYNDRVFSSYVNDIHTHFDKYKNHEIFSLASNLRKEYDISFDAVMDLALHIEQPPKLNPLFEFSSSLDDRWNNKNALEFIEILQQFYIDTDCESFFNEHEELYKVAEDRFGKVYESINIDWYEEYYGTKPDGSFNTIIGVGNGGFNYGASVNYPNGFKEKYSILGTYNIDTTNYPFYEVDKLLPTYVHEFNHSFINPLTKQYENELENAGKKLYDIVKWSMKAQEYSSWQTMINESLVRASVIRYLIKNNFEIEKAENQLKEEFGKGFFWIKGLVEILGEYELNRKEYPTFDSYMPILIGFFEKTAKESESMFKLEK